MSDTDLDTVRKTAHLARLDIGDAELAKLAGQFARILEAFQSIAKLEVEGVEPMTGPTDLADVVRADRPRPSLERESVLENAPARSGEYYSVPKTIAGQGGDAG